MSIALQSLQIDKLSFTFDIPLAQRDAFAREVNARGTRIDTRSRYASGYRSAVTLPRSDGRSALAFIACDPWRRYTRFVRVECNPDKNPLALGLLHALLTPFLPPAGWIAVRLSRVDLAVDYPIALQEFVAFARNQKARIFTGPSGIESAYLGAVRAARQIVIYDKAAELRHRAQRAPEHPLTRIEARLKPAGMSILDLPDLGNPFETLVIAQPVPTDWPYRFGLYLKEASAVGVNGVCRRLKRHERTRFRQMLAAAPVPFTHPATIFAREFVQAARLVVGHLTGRISSRRRRTPPTTGGRP